MNELVIELEEIAPKELFGEQNVNIELLKKYNITTFAAFVIGFPEETTESIDDNIRFIQETGLEFYSLKEFYYTHTAPIHKSRELYSLSGNGNTWEHKTMNSVEASAQKLRIFETIKNSVHIDSDSGLWYLAYLRECGFNWQEIKDLQNIITEMMLQDNKNDFFSKGPLIKKLEELLSKAKIKNKNYTLIPEAEMSREIASL